MEQLELHRARAHSFFLTILWLHVPLNVAVAWMLGNDLTLVTGASVLLAVVATLSWRFAPQPAIRITVAVALLGDVSLLLAATAGHPWQVDIHMYYFAAVALIALYCDPAAIVAAAAVVALHHLTLNFLLPNLVYPGGGDLGRVVLHAVILVVESAGLVWLAVMLTRAFNREHGAITVAEEARIAAEGIASELQSARDLERSRSSDQRVFEEQVATERRRIVETLATKLSRIADGDLTTRFDEEVDGQFRKVKDDFNEAASKLETALRAVSERALTVQTGTGEIARLSSELAQRNENQATSLDRTTSALEQITATVSRSSEGADHARQVVAAADRQAKSSSEVVEKAIAAMDAITKSSSRIGQIIGAIDEIAFQTNLLALNAGVEAARAGDSGRGFAVVASEVRALAQRSAQAAKEIKELVNESISTVGEGAKLVTDTGVSLRSIAATVTEINGIVNGIANAAKEQSTGLVEINIAVRQIDEMTQQNAAMAEESTAATHTLADESEHLAKLVSQFKVRDSGRGREETMRRELRDTAPHAFRAPSPKPAARAVTAPKPLARGSLAPVAKSTPAPVVSPRTPATPKRAAAGNDDWTEF